MHFGKSQGFSSLCEVWWSWVFCQGVHTQSGRDGWCDLKLAHWAWRSTWICFEVFRDSFLPLQNKHFHPSCSQQPLYKHKYLTLSGSEINAVLVSLSWNLNCALTCFTCLKVMSHLVYLILFVWLQYTLVVALLALVVSTIHNGYLGSSQNCLNLKSHISPERYKKIHKMLFCKVYFHKD